MTLPQPRLPGTTYFITTRCERRECRLPPDAETSAGIALALCDALGRHGVQLVAVSVPSNHLHMVVYDPGGFVSEFMRDAFALMARFGNARDGVRGWGFWDRQPALAQVLGDAETVVEKVAYTIANPTTSFLVEDPEQWPGVQTKVSELGRWRGRVYRRPKTFFSKRGWTSEAVEVCSELPPMVEAAYGIEGFQARVGARVAALVAGARAQAAASGRGFLGVAEVLRRGVWWRPESASGRGAGRSAAALRRVAAATRRRVRLMADALVAFRRAHRVAWEAFRRGLAVVFPAGTFKAWRFYGATRVAATWAAPSG